MSKQYSTPHKELLRELNTGHPGADNEESTTTTLMNRLSWNAEIKLFHGQAFQQYRHYPFAPCTCTRSDNSVSTPSPLSSPSSQYSNVSSCSTKMPSSDIEIATQKLIRQCQHLVSFICYEAIFSRKTMNKKEFAATLFDYYHGVEQRPTLINHAWYFVNGRGKFSCAFDNSNDDGLNRLLPELTQEDNSFIVNELLIEGKKKSSTLQ